MTLPVYIGFDPREADAYRVAEHSLRKHASVPVAVTPLELGKLYEQGLLVRPVERRDGRLWDHLSGANQSTEFATSRFAVPFLQRTGWALFVDCDMVFTGDVAELLALADPRYAVMCVKHGELPRAGTKMDGQVQAPYHRKNWSSVMLWNCDHPAHRRLTLELLNLWPGQCLHRFCWLKDEEIGALPEAWNWLVDVRPQPENLRLAHFTLGVPSMPGCENSEHAPLWWRAYQEAVA